MNTLDIIIIAIIVICAILGYRKGLLRAVYRLVSLVIAVFIARLIYPYVARFLGQTQLLLTVQDSITNTMNMQGIFNESLYNRGSEMIDTLPIPGALRTILHTNNTPYMFETLQVATMEEYISGFFANMIINAIAIVLVFVITLIALYIIGQVLDIVSKLPVINFINQLGGLIWGAVASTVFVWLCLVIVSLLAINMPPDFVVQLEGSGIVQWMFESTLPQLANVYGG